MWAEVPGALMLTPLEIGWSYRCLCGDAVANSRPAAVIQSNPTTACGMQQQAFILQLMYHRRAPWGPTTVGISTRTYGTTAWTTSRQMMLASRA